ncbi:hypothetical protein Dimus_019262 [Dionaea muscipula]
MLILATNSIFKVSFNLRCRLVSLSRLRKCSAVRCLKDRGYSSSLPVRYIPKQSRKVDKLGSSPGDNDPKDQNFNSSKVSERRIIDGQEAANGSRSWGRKYELESKKSAWTLSADARSDHLDRDSYSLELNECREPAGDSDHEVGRLNLEFKPEAVRVGKKLQVHDVSDKDERSELPSSISKKDAEKIVIELLAARTVTAVELQKILSAESFPPNIVEEVIDDFKHRLMGNDAFMSSKDGSAFPARYVPKKSQEVEQLKVSSEITFSEDGMITCSDADFCQHNASDARENDQSYDSESNEGIDYNVGMLEFELMEDDDQDDEELEPLKEQREAEQPKFCGSKSHAEKLAVQLLAKRACTAVELRKKLNAKGFRLSVVDRVVRDCQRRGLVNDYLYAEMFSRSRWSSMTWGPRKIKQALLMKGVDQADAQKALQLVFEGDGKAKADGEESTSSKLSKSSMNQLFAQASKRWILSQNLPTETRKTRIVRWLQYRGFDWGVVGIIMKQLESRHPA